MRHKSPMDLLVSRTQRTLEVKRGLTPGEFLRLLEVRKQVAEQVDVRHSFVAMVRKQHEGMFCGGEPVAIPTLAEIQAMPHYQELTLEIDRLNKAKDVLERRNREYLESKRGR